MPHNGTIELPNERIDLSQIHPSLHYLYGDGMPLKTYCTEGGAIVRILPGALPKTREENRRNIDRAFAVANAIADRAAIRYAEEAQKQQEAASSSHPADDP